MNNDFINKLKEISSRIPQAIKRLPGIAKVEGLNFIHDNFDKEGFEENKGVVKKWPERKPDKRKNKREGRQLLIDKGAMRRSFDQETTAQGNAVVFTSSMPYTEAHNDGLRAGRPPGFTMPERKMIGDSEALSDRIEAKFDKLIEGVFK